MADQSCQRSLLLPVTVISAAKWDNLFLLLSSSSSPFLLSASTFSKSFCPQLFSLCTSSPLHPIPLRQSNESRRIRKKGTSGMRTVTSTERREIARCNFARLLAEVTRREDQPRGKELLGGRGGARIFSLIATSEAHVSLRKERERSRIPLRQVSCKRRAYVISLCHRFSILRHFNHII